MRNFLDTGTRPPCGYLRPVTIALLASGVMFATEASAQTTNLVLNGTFLQGLSTAWNAPPGTTLSRVTRGDGSWTNVACIPASTDKIGINTQPNNLLTQDLKLVSALSANTRYELSFRVMGTTLPARLLASVNAEITQDGIYKENRYIEQQLPINSNSDSTYKWVFTTPKVIPKDGSGKNIRPKLMFQSLSLASPDAPKHSICVGSVSLVAKDGNFEVMNPVTPVIRYNQVVTSPESPSGALFTVISPPIPSTVELVRGTTVLKSAAITATEKDPHSNLEVYSFAAPAISADTVRLKDSAGNIVAQTEKLKVASSNPYKTHARDLARDALHFFYAQRAGQAITDGRYDSYRNQYSRAAGHQIELAKCFEGTPYLERLKEFEGKDLHGNNFANACPPGMPARDVRGGWYDAGDYGKYVVNAAASLWSLQNVIEVKQKEGRLNTDFPPGFLKYGNTSGRSDLLEEARHEMEWLLRMQITKADAAAYGGRFPVRVPVGNQDLKDKTDNVSEDANIVLPVGSKTYVATRYKIKLNLSEVDATNMVFSAVRDQDWSNIPIKPEDSKPTLEQPNLTRVLDYPTTHATLAFAAVAAQSARIWKGIDDAFAAKCLAAADDAWEAAKKNPQIYRYGEWSNEEDVVLPSIIVGGGAYAGGQKTVGSARMWAALELYLAGFKADLADDQKAQAYLRDGFPNGQNFGFFSESPSVVQDWGTPKNYGILSLLANGLNDQIIARRNAAGPFASTLTPLESLKTVAQEAVNNIQASAFGVPHAPGGPFNWASNAHIANNGVLLLAAARYGLALKPISGEQAARRVMSYLLGNNPLGKSYVTGYGSNPVMNPHHRFWAKHADISMPPAPPGMLVGGPNTLWGGTVVSNAKLGASGTTWVLDKSSGADIYMKTVMASCNKLDKPTTEGGSTFEKPAAGGISCYRDHVDLFMTNEVAINWNAPLFWMAAFLK